MREIWNNNREEKNWGGGGGGEEERERMRKRNRWYLLLLWVESLKREKLLQLQSQIKHNCQHYQGELMTTTFLLVHF